ncbi:hypothetical protein [Catalinimonas niigatensis]|uniref:hypothetical protein n=1 Tax=Catalinimonas niigatensis TaxID=1397264 RepID=UPI002666F890|nr:hypothetical protein [Catalinimonas niigatensis]WPP50619.1 hypothetical protein PZB72_28560 [Catalinimonas niigatensis]
MLILEHNHNTDRLEVRFQTLLAPPPYSHEYLLQLDFSLEEPLAYFQINYTDRDQLTEEEILEEGFSPEDDFEWKGALPKVWKAATLDFLNKTKTLIEKPKPNSQHLLELLIDYTNSEQTKGIPDNAEDWEYFVQEIIQAIYEISEKELPLEISYVEQGKSNKQIIHIHVRFSQRSLQVVQEKVGKKKEHNLLWEQLMPLLQAVYLPDYDPEKAKQNLPDAPGKYIDQGDGLWYELGKAVTNPSKKVDAVGKLEKMLKEFFS